jgi:hypothetical protein
MVKVPLALRSRLIEASLLATVLVAAFAIRVLYLDERPFWVDEAESSINALTILENGYPTDAYLGIPIYENTLIQQWPGNVEYEFRDLSYSDNHVAIYHGWLPLYTIAGSFVLHGVAPDKADGAHFVRHDLTERKRRTRAARLPAVLFGILFLAIVFVGARMLYGLDAAWAGLLVGSIYPYHIAISRQARYYSAEVALTTACAVSLFLFVKHCRWKHVYLSAVAFILLFHTHLLSFSTACVVCLLFVPFIVLRHEGGWRKLCVFAVLLTAGTVPWVIATGLHRQQVRIPRAWPLLDLPGDFWRYPPVLAPTAIAGVIVALLTAWIVLMKHRAPQRLIAPARQLAPVLLFLSVWAVCGYATFAAMIPAVSFDTGRLNLSYWGPLFLLTSMASAAIARAFSSRHSVVIAPVVMSAVFLATGHRLQFHRVPSMGTWKTEEIVLRQLKTMPLNSTTKLYAAPNDHLILSFYSGLPVQDITPVRKSFLDSYRGDIIYIDQSIAVDTGLLAPENIRAVALREGVRLSQEDAERWSILLRTRDYREYMLRSLSPGAPPQMESIPPFGWQLLFTHRTKLQSDLSNSSLNLVTRGFRMNSWSDWRNILKYRFVQPEMRSGIHANYADRLRGADVVILTDADTALYFSAWHPPGPTNQIAFRFVRGSNQSDASTAAMLR